MFEFSASASAITEDNVVEVYFIRRKSRTVWYDYDNSSIFEIKLTQKDEKRSREYFNKKLNEHKGDIKGTWKVLNMALGKRSKTTNFTTIKVNKKEISDPKEIGNTLNNHFCTTAD